MSGKNLLDTLNPNKKSDATSVSETSETKPGQSMVGNGATSDALVRGDVLTASKGKEETSSSTVEDDKTVKNPDDWSKDSALKEVVKLREENKVSRTKFQEQLDKIEKDAETKIAKIKEEAQTAWEAKKKLEALEADQADKKRSIEDKLAHREAKLAELETSYKHQLEAKEKELSSVRSKAAQYEAEQEARAQVYRNKIKEELDKVPEEFRSFADKMVKGYEDPHEAWISLAEAQRMGMFGEKKIVINHSVPGAADGARINKAKAEEAEKEARKKMTSRELIRNGLNQAKQGQNTAYRGR